jgi:3-oxoacyl-[acyl-carrier protein] reductase
MNEIEQGSEPVTSNRPRRVAVVTGGANGIGEQVVRNLSQKGGYKTVIADLNQNAAADLAAELSSAGAEVHAMPLDVSSTASINEFYNKLDATFGRCDALVNSAGIAKLAPFETFPLDLWHTILAINLTGPMLMVQRAVPLMKRNGWGRVVNVTSVSGLQASVGRTGYGTSKSALTGLTRQMAIELAPIGITVNAVAPGPVSTAMAEIHSARTRESYLRMVPMGRYATPAEVASAIAFLCSEEAGYITGHSIPVDGGYMAAGVLEA